MRVLSKLLYVAIILCAALFIVGCSNPLQPKINNCDALFHNGAPTRLTLVLDGSIIFDNNFMPGDNWVKKQLDDGTRHTFRVFATDPSVYSRSGSFSTQMGHTHAYEGLNYNAVIIIGGGTYDAATPIDTSISR